MKLPLNSEDSEAVKIIPYFLYIVMEKKVYFCSFPNLLASITPTASVSTTPGSPSGKTELFGLF